MRTNDPLTVRLCVARRFVARLGQTSEGAPAVNDRSSRQDARYIAALQRLQDLEAYTPEGRSGHAANALYDLRLEIARLSLEAGSRTHAENALLGIVAWGMGDGFGDDARILLEPFEANFNPDREFGHCSSSRA